MMSGSADRIDRQVASERAIHLVLDNGSSHVSKATRGWLADHPRFVARYTPVHASWVNQVELFFSIITRKVIKRGNFTSRQDPGSKLMRYIASGNRRGRAMPSPGNTRPVVQREAPAM